MNGMVRYSMRLRSPRERDPGSGQRGKRLKLSRAISSARRRIMFRKQGERETRLGDGNAGWNHSVLIGRRIDKILDIELKMSGKILELNEKITELNQFPFVLPEIAGDPYQR